MRHSNNLIYGISVFIQFYRTNVEMTCFKFRILHVVLTFESVLLFHRRIVNSICERNLPLPN